MPQRTNDFQELVSLIQKALVPEGATVTESAMVETSDGKSTREIDVLIESPLGPYRIRIAVEAKKESRKMDQVRFDAIVGKYLLVGGIRVNKIAVVSYSGFTEGVVHRAKLLDIELITLTEAESIDWSRLRPPELCLKSAVELLDFKFDESVRNTFGGTIPANAIVVCSCGWTHGPPLNYARHIFLLKVLRENRSQLMAFDEEVATQGIERKLRVDIRPGEPHRVSLQADDSKAEVVEFSFTIRLHKPAPVPEALVGHAMFSHAPHLCQVKIEPEIPGIIGKRLLDECKVKCSCCGREFGTVREWVTDLAFTKFFNKNKDAQTKLLEGLKQSPTGEAHLIGTWPIPKKFRIHNGEEVFAPTTVTVDIYAVAAKGSFEHKQYEMCHADGTSSRIDSFEAVAGGKRLRMVMPEGIASKKIVVRIDDAKPPSGTGAE